MSQRSGAALLGRVRAALNQRRPRVLVPSPGLSRAAVLLLLQDRGDDDYALFQRRSEHVEYHRGEVSLPGGAQDPGDGSLLETALRETHEELGIPPGDVEVLGALDERSTHPKSPFIVSPFVGAIPYPCPVTLHDAEAIELLEVPLGALRDSRNVEQTRGSGDPFFSHRFTVDGNVIHGLTAGIVRQFLDLVFPA